MKHPIILICFLLLVYQSHSEELKLTSPDSKIEITIVRSSDIGMIVYYQKQRLFDISNVSLNVNGQPFAASIKKIKKKNSYSVNEKIFIEFKCMIDIWKF